MLVDKVKIWYTSQIFYVIIVFEVTGLYLFKLILGKEQTPISVSIELKIIFNGPLKCNLFDKSVNYTSKAILWITLHCLSVCI